MQVMDHTTPKPLLSVKIDSKVSENWTDVGSGIHWSTLLNLKYVPMAG